MNSIAIGYQSKASGISSVALGDSTQATHANSVALGSGSLTSMDNTVSVGDVGSERRIMNVDAGQLLTDAVNISQTSRIDSAVLQGDNHTLDIIEKDILGNAVVSTNSVDLADLETTQGTTNTANITQNTTAIAAETTRATAAEQANAANITQNTTDIGTNTTAIAAETTRATAAEQANAANITQNTTDIGTNTTAIAAETTRATAAEQANATNITQNTSDIATNTAAIAADTDGDATNELNTNVALNGTSLDVTDAGGTLSADLAGLQTTLGTTNATDIGTNTAAIAAETTRATVAEQANAANITQNTTAIAAETTRATAAEQANAANITQNTSDITTNTAAIAADTDGDATNELNTNVALNGTSLDVTDAGGTLSADLAGLQTTLGTTNATDISNLQTGVLGSTISNTVLDANGIYTITEGTVDHATDFTNLITTQGTTNATTIAHNAGGVVNGTTIKSNRDLTTKVEYVNVTANQTAVGNGASTTAANGTAIGQNTEVNAAGSTALGHGAVVNVGATNSVALGQNSVATEANTVSVGSVGDERKITNVAKGTNTTDAVNVGQLTAVGSQVDTNTRGISSNSGRISANTQRIGAVEQRIQYIHIDQSTTALGKDAIATPAASIALGKSAEVQDGAQGSVAIGAHAKVNQGVQNAVAIGQYSVATESNTFSVGSDALKRRVVNVSDGINAYDAVNMRQFNGLERKMSGIGAMNSAMSALVPNQRVSSDTQLSVGLGYYDSEAAIAGGMFHYINDDVLLNAGVSYSRESGTAGRAGVTWGF